MKLKDLEGRDILIKNIKVRLSEPLYKLSSLPTYGIKTRKVWLVGPMMGDWFVKVNRKKTQIYPMFNELLGWDELKDLEVIEIYEESDSSS